MIQNLMYRKNIDLFIPTHKSNSAYLYYFILGIILSLIINKTLGSPKTYNSGILLISYTIFDVVSIIFYANSVYLTIKNFKSLIKQLKNQVLNF